MLGEARAHLFDSGHLGKERYDSFGKSRMSNRHVAQDGVGDTRFHRELDGSHGFTGTLAKTGEPQDLVVRRSDQHFKKSPRLRHRPGSQDGCHWDLGQAVPDALLLRLRFVKPYVGKFRVGIEAGWNLPSRSRALGARQVVADNAEIIERYMCEQGTAGAVAERPDTRSTRLQPLIHADIALFRGLHSSQVESDAFCVGYASRGYQQVGAFDDDLRLTPGTVQPHPVTRFSFYVAQAGICHNDDAFVLEELGDGLGNIRILTVKQPIIPLHDGYAAA